MALSDDPNCCILSLGYPSLFLFLFIHTSIYLSCQSPIHLQHVSSPRGHHAPHARLTAETEPLTLSPTRAIPASCNPGIQRPSTVSAPQSLSAICCFCSNRLTAQRTQPSRQVGLHTRLIENPRTVARFQVGACCLSLSQGKKARSLRREIAISGIRLLADGLFSLFYYRPACQLATIALHLGDLPNRPRLTLGLPGVSSPSAVHEDQSWSSALPGWLSFDSPWIPKVPTRQRILGSCLSIMPCLCP